MTFSFRFKEDLTRFVLRHNLETTALIKALGKEVGVSPDFPIKLLSIKVHPK
ncbi:MAG: hypothetical protein U5K72_02580 [Balneolaceae bacterium]|nr:hypothetical protein [Balneolaceae bacterium]